MFASRSRVRIIVAISVIFYYALLVFLLISTNWCASCAASQLWKYSVVASLPTLLVFLLRTTWKESPLTSSGIVVLLALAGILIISAYVAPIYTSIAFGQTYDIVYFSWVHISFPFAEALLLSIVLGLMSFNIASVLPRWRWRTKEELLTWVKLVFWDFSLIGWFVVLIQRLGIVNQLSAFGVLLISTTIVPLFTQTYRFRKTVPSWIATMVQIIGLGSLASLSGFLDFATGFPLWHPFFMVTLISSLGVCLSSPLGQMWSRYAEVGDPIAKSRIRYVLALIAVLFVVVTWYYAHAFISVGVSVSIHV